jgi:exonuclease VII large subunit
VLKDGLVACVFHIYTSKGAGYSDFNHTAEAMLASEGVRFFEQRMDGRAGDGVKKAIDALPVRSGDIVVIERGGGDLNHDSFRAFKSGECIAALKNLKAMGVTVVTGVGHAKDRFGFESYVDHAEITPTAAAQRLLSILSCEQDRKGTSELEDARNVF